MNTFNRKIHFIGTKIRSLRKMHGLTLQDMVVRCMQVDDKHSPSVSYLSLIETGRRNPSEELLVLLSQIFQKDVEWFLDDAIQENPIEKTDQTDNRAESMSLEPNFLFSKEILESAIPAMLSQTGTSGRQFAHILIRSYQEKNNNQFPDIERIAEEVGQKRMPLSVDDVIQLCINNGLQIKWFKRDTFTTSSDSGRVIKTLFRSFYDTPNILYINKALKNQPARLKYDLACLLGHKVLHNGDGILSSHATGGVIGGSPAPFEHQSSHIQQKDILYAWRDFECSFFAGALLCPKVPFKHFLNRESYNMNSYDKIGVTPSVMMRRMTCVSNYKHWHYFDAYSPGYLRAVYRENGITIPWSNMLIKSDPCSHWNIFKVINKTKIKKPYNQLLFKRNDGLSLYASISIRTKDASENIHVISTGIDLGPAIESQGMNKDELLNIINDKLGKGHKDIMLKGELQEQLLRVSRTLNMSWVEDSIYNPVQLICPQNKQCPRPILPKQKLDNKKNFSWLNEIKQDIIKKEKVR